MATAFSRLLSPAVLLYIFVFVTQFAHGLYVGAQLEYPQGVTFIFMIGMLWAVGWWLRTDSRRRRVLSVYDLGFFLYLAWPLIMPYYLVKTRGAKGLLVMLAFAAVYVGATILGMVLAVVIVTLRA
jgi:hypothetical protein